ncbi:MAG: hypothetical protein NC489_38570 [Ruminococcus flavefaciens]|nr:hypothetical protein [Ruminococcus flavefaciens]
MKVTLGQIFRYALTIAKDNIINSSDVFSEKPNDNTLGTLSYNIETYVRIKELMKIFEHCENVPFEEVLCRCFEEEENE